MSQEYDEDQDLQVSNNLIYNTLTPPSMLSSQFKRFYSEFESNIDYILKWDYQILNQLQSERLNKGDLTRLSQHYGNLLNKSREMCRRFTGPHSVLQVFLEKIISSISQIAETHRLYSEKTLCLWNEVRVPVEATVSNQGIIESSKVKSQGTETSLLITKKNCQGSEIAGKQAHVESEQ